jgi:LPS-assembly lipoprotein
MSLPDGRSGSAAACTRGVFLLAMLAMLAAASACTVRPLYGEPTAYSSAAAGGAVPQLSSVAVKPATSRYEQEVRNHLIFLLGGGAGEPPSPAYSLDLRVLARTESAAIQQVAQEDEPTAGTVTLTSNYVLSEVVTGNIVAVGSRAITASFDRPRQQFATMRAEQDAQNRAARELAELIRLAVAQDLEGARR